MSFHKKQSIRWYHNTVYTVKWPVIWEIKLKTWELDRTHPRQRALLLNDLKCRFELMHFVFYHVLVYG